MWPAPRGPRLAGRLASDPCPAPPKGQHHQQVAARARSRPLPSSMALAALLLVSMVPLHAAAPSRVEARPTGIQATSLQQAQQSRGGRSQSDRVEPTHATSEPDLESATISHPTTTRAARVGRPAGSDRLLELREPLRALSKMVGESRLATLVLDEEPEQAASSGGSLEESRAQASAIKQSLVRQLSRLMRNHERAETVARPEGRATRRQRQLAPTTSGAPLEPHWPASSAAPSSAGDEPLDNLLQLAEGQAGALGEHNLLPHSPDDELITCPPDYDDRNTLLVPTNISELFGDSYVANVSSLTAEQRQQLLSGADAPALLAGGGAEGAAGELNETALLQQQLEWQQQQQHRQMQMRPPCRSVGMTRIELITKRITPILFCIIIVIGLVGNVVVMLVILEERKVDRELTPTNLLILDLSLADLSFIIFCIPFTGWDYATGYWAFGSPWCKLNQYLIVVCALSSIYTLVLMSCDRFMAIVYPIECISYRTSRNMMYAIVIKWIVILLAASPAIEMHGLISSPIVSEQPICRFLADHHNPLHFQIVFFLTSYLLPLVLIFGLYLSLLNKLWFGQRPQGHKESHKMLESKKRVTWLVASIVIVFAVCWCPIQIMLILMRLKSIEITATYIAIQVFAHTLGYMNSCVNPIVYAFASETFYQSFRRSYLSRLLCCAPSSNYSNNANNGLTHTHTHTNTTTNNNNTLVSQANNSSRPHNFKQFTHQPDAAITLTTHLHTGQHKLGPTSSLQITNGAHAGRRNSSLDYIFEQAAGDVKERARDERARSAQVPHAASRLPLEPRDRDQVISPTPPHLGTIHRPTPAPAPAPTANNELVARVSGNSPSNCSPASESTNLNTTTAGAKQQLVARVVRQSSATSNQVVAHQCEPCANEY